MNEAVENNLRKYFWEFVKNDRQTTGPDTHLAMVAEHFNKNKSPEIQAWQGGCYVNPYNVPTGYHVWKNWNYKEVLKDNDSHCCGIYPTNNPFFMKQTIYHNLKFCIGAMRWYLNDKEIETNTDYSLLED